MELLDYWESITEDDRDDAAQLRRDFDHHSRTSYHSLRHFVKVLAVDGVTGPVKELDVLNAWLSANQSELPAEIEDERGNRGSSQSQEFLRNDYEELDWSTEDDYALEQGLYFVGNPVCYASLDQWGRADDDYREHGLIPQTYIKLMTKRGKAFAKHHAEQNREVRWRGMEEFNGVTRALEYIDAGVRMRSSDSGAIPLPTQEELHAAFDYDGLTFTWRKRSGVKAGSRAFSIKKGKAQTKFAGTDYVTGRLVWMHRMGEDPGSATISYKDGDPTNLAWENLTLERLAAKASTSGTYERPRKTEDSKWAARIRADEEQLPLGEYRTEEQAESAYALALRTFIRFGS